MVAKTDEEKAAAEVEKDNAAEQARLEKQAAIDKKAAEDAAASVSAAAAEAQVHADANVQEKADAISERVEGRDDSKVDGKRFGGQVHSSDHYVVGTSDTLGRSSLTITPAGWVGPAPLEVPASRVKELVDLLGKVKNLPKE